MLRKILPSWLKREIRLVQRAIADRPLKRSNNFATKNAKIILKNEYLIAKIEQPIHPNPLAENKIFNIQLATQEIQQVIIQPNEVFSFWRIVGKPTKKKGYKIGRNIINNELQADIGGGLCQVSGMIYHLALTCGMKIEERFNHTVDLYEEDNRYTPLGMDATVVFGHKDLRFRNTKKVPVLLRFRVNSEKFIGYLYAGEEFKTDELNLVREEFENYRTIKTYQVEENKEEFINLSHYLKLNK
jgi:vancomycin resistance protein VanW